ncbi:MAG TPA: N-acetyl-gamma-glutamyl-phosphate reductase [Chitinophagales bacterium]|nr:N-acetyl-gamma-glutamyl-phosphate reductase [Chitinophagales bacterium]
MKKKKLSDDFQRKTVRALRSFGEGAGMRLAAGVVGAAGYTGGELLRLLLHHPDAEIAFAHSNSQAGKFIYEVHTDLIGDTGLRFTGKMAQADVLFLCTSHNDSGKFLETNTIDAKTKIIDLSQDFRLKPNNMFNGRSFVYGLPELNRDEIRKADNVANPGCFATAIQLGLLPLAKNKLLKDDIHVSATTGSTGAGQSPSQTTHFTWRHGNVSTYKVFEHQHLAEISQSLKQLQDDFTGNVNFIPHRGNFTRGILASIYTNTTINLDEALSLYKKYYASHPFVHISHAPLDVKQVVNTSKCLLHLEKHGEKLFITSIIDNLLKGASGQAVQNMNLMFGLDETAGLKLKASYF